MPTMPCPLCRTAALQPWCRVDACDYLRCRCCRLTVREPAAWPTAEAEYAHYRQHENHSADPRYRAFLSALAEPLLACLPRPASGLDYGCGPGPALAAMLTEAGHAVRLYDPFFYPDAEALQQGYDFVTCTEAVEHFHRPAAEFARFNALLRPGGWLGIMTGLLDDGIDFAGWHYRRDPTHVLFYGRATFEWLAGHYGWQCTFPARNAVLLRQAG